MRSTEPRTCIFMAFVLSVVLGSCNQSNQNSGKADIALPSVGKAELESKAWEMEELYWDYVQRIDTVNYKKLWHSNFIGYPSFGDGVSDKTKIASWIPELHKDTSLTFSYKLYKRAVNAIEDVVIVFYDTDEMWTDRRNNVVRKETYKFTHTWKKINDSWLILGGMAAKKDQEVLTD